MQRILTVIGGLLFDRRETQASMEEVLTSLERLGFDSSQRCAEEMLTRLADETFPARFPQRTLKVDALVKVAYEASERMRPPATPSLPQLSGAEILAHEAMRQDAGFTMTWSQIADGESLTVQIKKGAGSSMFRLSATLSSMPTMPMRFELKIDPKEQSVVYFDLRGNGEFEGRAITGIGLARMLTDLAARLAKATVPADGVVHGEAFHSAEQARAASGMLDDDTAKELRQRRIRFWQGAGLAFEPDAANGYVELRSDRVRFHSTVGALSVAEQSGQRILGKFDMFPKLTEFCGPEPKTLERNHVQPVLDDSDCRISK